MVIQITGELHGAMHFQVLKTRYCKFTKQHQLLRIPALVSARASKLAVR